MGGQGIYNTTREDASLHHLRGRQPSESRSQPQPAFRKRAACPTMAESNGADQLDRSRTSLQSDSKSQQDHTGASKPLVIFGSSEVAELAHFYFRHSGRKVLAFTVDKSYLQETSYQGLPVVPFDEVYSLFPPCEVDMFIALGYTKLNAARREKYIAARALGYRLASYVSDRATILNGGQIGANCFILEDNTIQPFARIGNNVTMWSGNHIGHHSIIHDHCFIASHVVVSGRVEVGEQCFLGVNVTVRDAVHIGARCVLGAGALLLQDAEPEGVYVGTPSPRSRVPSSRLRGL
jgi:sugar O-acyltransferase (sialic acid O-acetyltransferase NeuD family)